MPLNVNSVASSCLCTQCGTCVGMCPASAIRMVIDKRRGVYIPQLIDDKCVHCGICLNVCPSHSVDFDRFNLEISRSEPEKALLGTFTRCSLSHATDHYIRYNSSSGGLVTSLLIFALEQRLIDGALVTRMKKENPLEPEPFIARTKEEVLESSRSKYCPVPANIALKEILLEEGKFAVVGLPCHIQGLRKAEAINEKLKEKIVLRLGIFCSHTASFKGTEFLLHKLGIKSEDVAQIVYRGEGWPGKVKVKLKDGSEKTVQLGDPLWFTCFNMFSPLYCLLCHDLTAELADISFGDPWLPEISAIEYEGRSIVISRSNQGEALLQAAKSHGIIELSTLDPKDVIRSQKTFLHLKKVNLKSRIKLMKLFGIISPLAKYRITDSLHNRLLSSFLFANNYAFQIPLLKYVPTRLLNMYISAFYSLYTIIITRDFSEWYPLGNN